MGTAAGIQLWRAGRDRDVVFWDRLWSRCVGWLYIPDTRSYPAPSSVCISPAISHLAWYQKVSSLLVSARSGMLISEGQKPVHVLGLNRKGEAIGMPQELRHPREIDWIGWRKSVSSSYAIYKTMKSNLTIQRRRCSVYDHSQHCLPDLLARFG